MKENVKQVDLGNTGGWVEVVLPRDENVIELGVGEEFIGIYVGTKPNPTFPKDIIHVFESDGGNLRMMYGRVNLDRWLKVVDFGNRVKVKRLEDRKVGQPKPMQLFKVWVWEDV